MMKRNILALLTLGSALAGTAAFASTSADDTAEVTAFLNAGQDMSAAISAAEAASSGKAVAAEFDSKDGTGFYEVDTIANGKQVSVEIDAASGKVIKTADEGDIAKADDADIVDPSQLGAPLAQLVATAETNGGGKVMAISLAHDGNASGQIEVEMANADGSMQEFAMAADGTMTKVATDDEGDHDGQEGGEADETGEDAD